MLAFGAYAAMLPFAAGLLASKAAGAAFKSARLSLYRHRARVEREFARRVAGRLRDLRGAPGAAYRRALRELAAERVRLEDERAAETLSDQPGAGAHRAAGRARRDKAWEAWFAALERAASESDAPSRDLATRPPGRRGAPIRRLCERSVREPPSPERVLAQWEKARGRGKVEEKIRLGSMLLDAEATVDSSLVRNAGGEIVGRRGGLRAWLDEACPSLSRHYAALMGYRRLAASVRREHGFGDPAPAALLVEEDASSERGLPPGMRAALPGARAAVRTMLAAPNLATVASFRAQLLAMQDMRMAAMGRRRRA